MATMPFSEDTGNISSNGRIRTSSNDMEIIMDVLNDLGGRWMDGWMDGWMEGWMDGWMDG